MPTAAQAIALEVLRSARASSEGGPALTASLDDIGLDLVGRFLVVEELDRRYGPTPPELISTWSTWDDVVHYIDRRELDHRDG